MDKNFFEEHKQDFEYLEALRRSGEVNMFGARPYLMRARSLSKEEAKQVLDFWMRNYHEVTTRIQEGNK